MVGVSPDAQLVAGEAGCLPWNDVGTNHAALAVDAGRSPRRTEPKAALVRSFVVGECHIVTRHHNELGRCDHLIPFVLLDASRDRLDACVCVLAQGLREGARPRLVPGEAPVVQACVGGMDWKDVRPLIEQHLAPLGIPVILYTTYAAGRAAEEPKLAA